MQSDISEWGARDPYYTLEKLRKALRDFNEAEGTLPERLYESWFQLHLLTVEDFPPSLQFHFCEMIRALTARKDPTPPNTPGRIGDARNTINGMAGPECLRIVGLLTALIVKVEVSLGDQSSPLARYLDTRTSAEA